MINEIASHYIFISDGLSVLTPDVFVGMTEKNIEYSDIYKDCSIELDFSSSTGNILTPGELYAINIAALNMKEGLFLSSTDQVSFQYVQRPLNGIVEVYVILCTFLLDYTIYKESYPTHLYVGVGVCVRVKIAG